MDCGRLGRSIRGSRGRLSNLVGRLAKSRFTVLKLGRLVGSRGGWVCRYTKSGVWKIL